MSQATNNTSIIGARLLDLTAIPDTSTDVHIVDGVICDKPATDSQIIDATGMVLSPGFVDLYARLREPGLTRKGTLASECHAALAAGFTTLLCSPDTHPVIDSTATVELIRQRAQQAGGARVIPLAALTANLEGQRLSEIATLRDAGCVGASQADQPIADTSVLLSAMEYAATFDIPLLLTARDPQIGGAGCAHAGAVATRLGLPGIPAATETIGLARLIELCRDTACRLHISRISTARGVEQIHAAKQAGLSITADVGIHHLFFTEKHINGFDVNFHSSVPFRSEQDRDALRAGVANGTIDAICSDHAPHDTDAKLAPFPSSAAGLSAFDVFLPLLMQLPALLDVPLSKILSAVTTMPANILATETVESTLAAGKSANLVLFDPAAPAQCTSANFLSQGRNTPFLDCDDANIHLESGLPFTGKVHTVWLRGVPTTFIQ
ncbi:MAG: dihydroorotase [Granulosicoccaceae bacterium]